MPSRQMECLPVELNLRLQQERCVKSRDLPVNCCSNTFWYSWDITRWIGRTSRVRVGGAELRVGGLGWSLQWKWVCPVGRRDFQMCKTQCGDFIFLHWALDQIATSSILDHVTTYRRGISSSHLPKLLVVFWTLVIVQATFFVFRGLRVCQDPLQHEYVLACPICSTSSTHYWISFNGFVL